MNIKHCIVTICCVMELLVAGCATGPEGTSTFEPPVYPPPPEQPRFIFDMTLVSSTQVKKEDKETRMRRMFTGVTETGKSMSKPFDVATCKGRVYVSDTVKRRVLVFDFAGGRYFEIGDKEPGSLRKPLGLSTDAMCNLYVADTTQKRVVQYDQDGNYLTAIGGSQYFDRLSHVAVNPEGTRIFAVDTGGVESRNHHIRVFDVQSGEHLYDIGERGTEQGQLNLPRDIELAPNGDLYVVDSGNFRVQAFTQEGEFVRSFGKIGRAWGQFSRPKGIAADRDNNIYVADASFANFQIFDFQGQLLLNIGDRSGKGEPGKYVLPAGIDVDEDGRIYFVGQYYRKVDIFRPAALPAEAGYLGTRLSKTDK